MKSNLGASRSVLLALLMSVLVLIGCEQESILSETDEADRDHARAGMSVGASADVVPGRFIVTLREGAVPASVAAEHGITPDYVYTHALNGFAGEMSDAARDGLLRDSRVTRVEPDQIVRAFAEQLNATWGLDRIDQRSGTDTKYTYNNTGSGVVAYIVDTGILTTHTDFGGRAIHGYDAVDSDYDATDCNGHGTHVAGTVGGTTWGVAKGVSLVAVRVLDCNGSGTVSGVVAGVDWVTGDHNTRSSAGNASSVANMSLGGGASSTLDSAVQRSIDAGVSYAIAAGNGNQGGKEQDACGYSPARVTAAMTIGATEQTDTKTSWSNYGDCVDWFAPGYKITSAWYTSDTATNTISGTSMATPHTAGVAALYLEANAGASPLTVRTALYDALTKGVVKSSKTTNNHLLYSLVASGGSTTEPTQTPAAPSNLGATTVSSSRIDLSWTDNSTDESGFEIYRSTSSFTEVTGATLIHTTGAGVTSYANDGLSASTTYYYRVRAINSAGVSALSNEASAMTQAASAGITLSATGYKVKGLLAADLVWSGATSALVDVWRKDGSGSFGLITTTDNDGKHTDQTSYVGGGTLTYRVCEAGTSTCSPDVSVTF